MSSWVRACGQSSERPYEYVRGSSALVLFGELCIATGACPNDGVMGSTSGTMKL